MPAVTDDAHQQAAAKMREVLGHLRKAKGFNSAGRLPAGQRSQGGFRDFQDRRRQLFSTAIGHGSCIGGPNGRAAEVNVLRAGMQAFTFRLQALLDQKLDLEAKARVAVAEKERALHEQRDIFLRLLENEKRIELFLFGARKELLLTHVTNMGADIQRRNDYVAALGEDLRAAHERTVVQKFAVEEAEIKLNEAQGYALECFREAKKLVRYREKLEKRFLAEAAKKEELEQNELGTTMYLSRRAAR